MSTDDSPEWGKCRECGVQLSEDNWADGPWIDFLENDWCVSCWNAEVKTVECVQCFKSITGWEGVDFREGWNLVEDKPTGEFKCMSCCAESDRQARWEETFKMGGYR